MRAFPPKLSSDPSALDDDDRADWGTGICDPLCGEDEDTPEGLPDDYDGSNWPECGET